MDKLNKKGLQKLLDETVEQLSAVLAKAEVEGTESLAKADPGEETSAEKTPSKESQKESAPEGSPAEESSSSEGPKEGPPSEAPAEAPPAAPAAEGAAPGGDPAQEMAGEVTVEGLQAEYQAMPVEEQKMHLLALKAALMTTMAAAEPKAPAAPAMAAEGPADAPPMAPPPAAPPAMAPGPALMRSETDPETLARIETLEKAVKEKDQIIEGFGKVAEGLKNLLVSNRKSVHSVSLVGKPGDQLTKSENDVTSLTKSQVDQKLKEVIAKGNLKKSDKDLIIEFTAGRNPDVSKIAHLIKV